MKKVLLSAIMCFALLASGTVVAQDNKDAKTKTEKTCTKKDTKDKKDCCKKGDKATDKKDCCKEGAATKESAKSSSSK